MGCLWDGVPWGVSRGRGHEYNLEGRPLHEELLEEQEEEVGMQVTLVHLFVSVRSLAVGHGAVCPRWR
jgi:hypothetical protein